MSAPASHARGRSDSTLGLVGRDLARIPQWLRSRPRVAAPLIALALIAALSMAALRIDLIRMRYALAEGVAQEQQLLEKQRQLTVDLRQLRHPARLSERAEALGFARPERVIDLADPAGPAGPARDRAGAPVVHARQSSPLAADKAELELAAGSRP